MLKSGALPALPDPQSRPRRARARGSAYSSRAASSAGTAAEYVMLSPGHGTTFLSDTAVSSWIDLDTAGGIERDALPTVMISTCCSDPIESASSHESVGECDRVVAAALSVIHPGHQRVLGPNQRRVGRRVPGRHPEQRDEQYDQGPEGSGAAILGRAHGRRPAAIGGHAQAGSTRRTSRL